MSTAAHSSARADAGVPYLENGDRLTRYEFERRYDAMAHVKKAELIEGVVYMGSPVGADEHAEPHAIVMGWLMNFAAQHPEVQAGDNGTVILDTDNEYQPDAFLRLREGGLSQKRKYIEGPPELVLEVASSSISIDLHDKKNAYRRSGVPEYVVWRVRDNAVSWFVLDEGEYVLLEPGADGIIESRVFPGLRLNVPALLALDLAGVLATQQGER